MATIITTTETIPGRKPPEWMDAAEAAKKSRYQDKTVTVHRIVGTVTSIRNERHAEVVTLDDGTEVADWGQHFLGLSSYHLDELVGTSIKVRSTRRDGDWYDVETVEFA